MVGTSAIEGIDGIDIWYGFMESTTVKLYDYIEKGHSLSNVFFGTIIKEKCKYV